MQKVECYQTSSLQVAWQCSISARRDPWESPIRNPVVNHAPYAIFRLGREAVIRYKVYQVLIWAIHQSVLFLVYTTTSPSLFPLWLHVAKS
jgi:hypothetical protein